VADGVHKLRVQSGANRVEIALEARDGAVSIQRPAPSNDLETVVVFARNDRGVLATSLDDAPVQIDNAAAGKPTNGILSLPPLSKGSHTLTVGSAQRQWSGPFSSGPAPEVSVNVVSLSNQGTVSVSIVGAAQARISVDSFDRGQVDQGKPVRLTLKPGKHEIVAFRENY